MLVARVSSVSFVENAPAPPHDHPPRVHLEMGVALQRRNRHEGAAVAEREARFGAAIVAAPPCQVRAIKSLKPPVSPRRAAPRGVLIGLPTLRLRGDYLAIVTLGFGEIMPQIALNGDNLFNTGFNLTNGPQGINPIDPPGFGTTLENALGLPESYLAPGDNALGLFNNSLELYFWTALGLVLFTAFCSMRLRDSRLGRAWIAIREDETAAAAMGVPLMRTKTWAYAAGAFFGGIAGAYYASFKSGTFPADFYFNISVFILCMVILGGMGNIWGVIVGGGFLAYLNQEGLGNIGAWINERFSTGSAEWVGCLKEPIDVPLYQFGIFGVILVLVMLFKPEGLIPSARRKAEFEEGVHDEPLVTK